eukprot:NODE_14905_length_1078_cov_19.498423.p1 GENE.NODE_14905_length_1078_cov_19.498423~~NODE_14905_length_1078_cov_19.498423.p1  ORF type:complete len:284 (+),score=53.29 NODE_14905_length_1078_cov_19.498423:149-1000(+)
MEVVEWAWTQLDLAATWYRAPSLDAWLASSLLTFGVGVYLSSVIGIFISISTLELLSVLPPFRRARICYDNKPREEKLAESWRVRPWGQQFGDSVTALSKMLPFVLILAGVSEPILMPVQPYQGWFPTLLSFLALVVVNDFGLYWGHRVQHESRFLWEHAHHYHHAILTPTAVTVTSIADVDSILQGPLPILVALVVVQPHPFIYYIFCILRFGENTLNHSGIDHPLLNIVTLKALPLRATIRHHDAHHRCCNHPFRATNYGETFIIWDWLFGTLRTVKPRKE